MAAQGSSQAVTSTNVPPAPSAAVAVPAAAAVAPAPAAATQIRPTPPAAAQQQPQAVVTKPAAAAVQQPQTSAVDLVIDEVLGGDLSTQERDRMADEMAYSYYSAVRDSAGDQLDPETAAQLNQLAAITQAEKGR